MSDPFRQALEQATGEIYQARACLLQPSPASLDRCYAAFERAAAALRTIESQLSHQPGPSHLPAAIQDFRRGLQRNQVLLASAADLAFGARQSEIATAGLYDRQVRPALTGDPHRVFVTG